MTPEQIKIKVKESFENVESKEFLEKQIKRGVEKHRLNYREFKTLNPDKDFNYWKMRNEQINVNSTNNAEIMAMGIFLLALDEFKPDD